MKPKRIEWTPPVPDDPRYMSPPKLEDHPDYHEDRIYTYSMQTRLLEGMVKSRFQYSAFFKLSTGHCPSAEKKYLQCLNKMIPWNLSNETFVVQMREEFDHFLGIVRMKSYVLSLS